MSEVVVEEKDEEEFSNCDAAEEVNMRQDVSATLFAMRTPGSGGEFGGRRLRALLSHVGIDSKLPLLLTSYTALRHIRNANKSSA